jgi:hypothetical protein
VKIGKKPVGTPPVPDDKFLLIKNLRTTYPACPIGWAGKVIEKESKNLFISPLVAEWLKMYA